MFHKLLYMLILLGTISLFAEEDPAELFVEKKCVKCHEVTSLSIETISDKDPSEVKDLSNAGTDFDSADAIKAYLMREVERNGKKHKTKFKGEDSELQKLVDWILTLKSA